MGQLVGQQLGRTHHDQTSFDFLHTFWHFIFAGATSLGQKLCRGHHDQTPLDFLHITDTLFYPFFDVFRNLRRDFDTYRNTDNQTTTKRRIVQTNKQNETNTHATTQIQISRHTQANTHRTRRNLLISVICNLAVFFVLSDVMVTAIAWAYIRKQANETDNKHTYTSAQPHEHGTIPTLTPRSRIRNVEQKEGPLKTHNTKETNK